MAEHRASVEVNAPVHQVYAMWTHFNDYPKFMSYVREVTYRDDQTSHWVVDFFGRHEWDAVNEGWQENRRIGWRSTSGLENSGSVEFEPVNDTRTRVSVLVAYDPPAGILGDIGEALGVGSRFEQTLQHDLEHFARMVESAPPGALDPESSSYLFHQDSAATKGETTPAQDQSMAQDPKEAHVGGDHLDRGATTLDEDEYADTVHAASVGMTGSAAIVAGAAGSMAANTGADATASSPDLDSESDQLIQAGTSGRTAMAENETPRYQPSGGDLGELTVQPGGSSISAGTGQAGDNPGGMPDTREAGGLQNTAAASVVNSSRDVGTSMTGVPGSSTGAVSYSSGSASGAGIASGGGMSGSLSGMGGAVTSNDDLLEPTEPAAGMSGGGGGPEITDDPLAGASTGGADMTRASGLSDTSVGTATPLNDVNQPAPNGPTADMTMGTGIAGELSDDMQEDSDLSLGATSAAGSGRPL